MSAELFAQIAKLNPTLQGWCSDQRADETAAVVVALRPKTVVVIGVFGGRDTIAAALACRSVGGGQVIAIDPWSAKASVDGQGEENTKWWSDQEMHEKVYQGFRRALNDVGLGPDWVDVRRARSDDVEPPVNIGLLLSDGNHGPQAIRDIERYAPNVIVGGFAYLDDLAWEGGAVLASVQKILDLGFIELHKRDGGAWFQRVR